MQQMRKRATISLRMLDGVALGIFFLTAVTVGYAAGEHVKGKAVQQPAQGQQLCPATPGAETCKIVLDCPPITAPGKTTCQAAIDCPGTKQPIKTKNQPKSK